MNVGAVSSGVTLAALAIVRFNHYVCMPQPNSSQTMVKLSMDAAEVDGCAMKTAVLVQCPCSALGPRFYKYPSAASVLPAATVVTGKA